MPHPIGKRPSPLSIRLTVEERKTLEQKAGSQPLSTYVKALLFSQRRPTGSARGLISADRVLLAQLLGQLGASGLSASLSRMATAAETGSLHVDDLVAGQLSQACDDIRAMHLILLQALNAKLPEKPQRLTAIFHRTAVDPEVGE